jgi:DNA-binding beta-propeller fold protein YncE
MGVSRVRIGFGTLCIVALVTALPAQAAGPQWHLVKSVKLGPPDSWDFVSLGPQGKRVYVSQRDKISIVDTETAKLIGTVGPIEGAHDAVAVPSVGRLYADNGKSGTVSVFDAKTLKHLGEIPTQPDSDAMAYDDASGILIVSNGNSGTATLIDPKTDKALATFKIGPGGEGIATDGRGHAFINISDGRAMVRIDLAAHKVDALWPLKSCESPHGLAINRETQRLFVSCRNNTMLVVDSTDGKTIASLPIGRGTDSAAFDPKRKFAFSSNKDGTISVIAEEGRDLYRALSPIRTAPGAGTMAEDPTNGWIYVVTADITKVLPAHHHGEVPEYAFRPGTVKLLIFAPAQ